MTIFKEDIDKFKKIYKKKFGKNLSSQCALEKASKLLRLVEIVYKPMTQKEYDKVQKRRIETK